MIEVLLTEDGKINNSAIQNYIQSFGLDSPYFGFNDDYEQQTPLFAAVNSKEIKEEVKLELVSYLLEMGENIHDVNTNKEGGLIARALIQNNIRLADLLLSFGAGVDYANGSQNLIDLAIGTKNPEVTLWILKNAQFLFFSLDTNTFVYKMDCLKKMYLDNLEVTDALRNIEQEYIQKKHAVTLAKFGCLGLIDKEVTALIIAAEMVKKNRNNTIFVITNDDIPILVKEIKKLLESDTVDSKIKFQIIHFPFKHAIFGEFIIDKSLAKPKVTYVHCDPLPPMTKYDDIITKDFIAEISPIASIEIIDSDVTIQKSIGCSYFSIDGALMLGAPEELSYIPNLIKHMKEHIIEEKRLYENEDVIYIKSSSIPTRFIRGMQFYEDDNETGSHYIKGLSTLVFNSQERHTIVNKKNQTAEESITPDLESRTSKSRSNVVFKANLRVERKMKQYGQYLQSFLQKFSIIDPKTRELVENCKIRGLVAFFDSKKQKKKYGVNS